MNNKYIRSNLIKHDLNNLNKKEIKEKYKDFNYLLNFIKEKGIMNFNYIINGQELKLFIQHNYQNIDIANQQNFII